MSHILDRRTLLQTGTQGALGLLVARWLGSSVALADATPGAIPAATPAGKAKACIVLYLNGGPSQLDTFDPKPGTATGGPFKAIATRSPAIRLSQHLPHIAEQADKLAVVRALGSKEGNHQRAQYLLHTGYSPNPTVVHPALGAWASKRLGDVDADLPSFISLGGPSAQAGILGVENGPFVVQRGGGIPDNVGRATGVSDGRFARRAAGLDVIEQHFASQTSDPMVAGRRAVYAKAMRLMHSPRVSAFDLSSEPTALKTAYGDSDFGRGCLTARRLVESGVKLVEVVLDGWDTHQNNFERVKDLSAQLDPAMGTLIHDLSQRGLLASTLVVCIGDFGRTPKINGNDGRDHFPQASFAALAGGGVRGGIVHGETDADGSKVVRDPMSVPNLFATMATLLGIPLDFEAVAPSGRPIKVTDHGTPVPALISVDCGWMSYRAGHAGATAGRRSTPTGQVRRARAGRGRVLPGAAEAPPKEVATGLASPRGAAACAAGGVDEDGDGLADACEAKLAGALRADRDHSSSAETSSFPTDVDDFLPRTALAVVDDACRAGARPARRPGRARASGAAPATPPLLATGPGLTSYGSRSERKHRTSSSSSTRLGSAADESADGRHWRTYVHAYPNDRGGVTLQYWRLSMPSTVASWVTAATGNRRRSCFGGDGTAARVRLLGHTSIDDLRPAELRWEGTHPVIFSEVGGHASRARGEAIAAEGCVPTAKRAP